jgi:spermidine/putrescine transport system substrate-binding protein
MVGKKALLVLLRSSYIIGWCALFIGLLFIPRLFEQLRGDHSLTILTWTDMVDPSIIEEFEKETGIKVQLSYIENNDELLAKLISTQAAGYDLIMPSDYLIPLLIEKQLIQPLDKSRINIWERFDPHTLNHYFDPDNKYSLPYYWGMYGIGMSPALSAQAAVTDWHLIFNPPAGIRVSMFENPREAVLLAGYYLFNKTEDFTEQEITQIGIVLKEQKKIVAAYTEARSDYLLLSGTADAVILATPFMHRLYKTDPTLSFVILQRGAFAMFDSWVIPKGTQHLPALYSFINFIYRPEIIRQHMEKFIFFSATRDLVPYLKEIGTHPAILKAYQQPPEPLLFFKNSINPMVVNKLWIDLKAL